MAVLNFNRNEGRATSYLLVLVLQAVAPASGNFRQKLGTHVCVSDTLTGRENTMKENLLELIGGRNTIQAAAEVFYKRVLEDDRLRPFFGQSDIAHLRSRQVMFVSMLLGGRVYTGKDIHGAHADARDRGINHAHFDLFLNHFRAALEEVGVEPENAEQIVKLLESKRKTIVDP